MRYLIAEFELDRVRRELRRNGSRIPLQPKPYLLLAYLVQNRQRLVSNDEMAQVLWPDEHVGPNTLATCLGRLRKTLGPDAKGWIQTRSKAGASASDACARLLPRTLRFSAPRKRARVVALLGKRARDRLASLQFSRRS